MSSQLPFMYSNDLVHVEAIRNQGTVTMAFEERLRRFIKVYDDMEKKVSQDDLFNKEFSVS